MVLNAGQEPTRWVIENWIPAPQGTGAGQGSPGGNVTASSGDLATVTVSALFQSSQVPPDMSRVDYDDTSGMSSDNSNQMWLTGQEQDSAAWTASATHINQSPHPNGWRAS